MATLPRGNQPRKLKPGDQVQVYRDPCTESQPEGTATLVKALGQEPGAYERWQLHFDDDIDECYVERSVRFANLIPNQADPNADPDPLDAALDACDGEIDLVGGES